jgi:cytochrome c oxidase cbb3-type subunit 3
VDIGKRDPITGQTITGHEWNGIEELNTPIPRVVLFFLAVTILFSVIYWILMPAWPIGTTYTRGLLGLDQKDIVQMQVERAQAERGAWTDEVVARSFDAIAADPELMTKIGETGPTLFADNCGVCHGVEGTGNPGFPDLSAKSWLWGGDPETLAETIRVGINATHPETRQSQMLAFGRDGILARSEIKDVAAYVQSLSDPQAVSGEPPERIQSGSDLFADNCAACHGEDARGMTEVGAPDLSDSIWIYGGDRQAILTTLMQGRQGQMPAWENRLSPTEIKILAIYVGTLGRTSQ